MSDIMRIIVFLVFSSFIFSPYLYITSTLYLGGLLGADTPKKYSAYSLSLSIILLFVFTASLGLLCTYFLTFLSTAFIGYFAILLAISGTTMGGYLIYQGSQERHHIHARLVKKLYGIVNTKRPTTIGTKAGLIFIEGTLEFSFVTYLLLLLLFRLEAHNPYNLAYLYATSLIGIPVLLGGAFLLGTKTTTLQNWVSKHSNEMFIYNGLVILTLSWLVLLSICGVTYVG